MRSGSNGQGYLRIEAWWECRRSGWQMTQEPFHVEKREACLLVRWARWCMGAQGRGLQRRECQRQACAQIGGC